jgi:imidazole glycerol-phosphate synthase subunit HisH
MATVTVIDCGAGNIQSVVNAFRRAGCPDAMVATNGDELAAQDPSHIVLPGVGAIGAMLTSLHERGLVDVLHRLVIVEKRPLLGICVGMQVLAEECTEFGAFAGLGWIPGTVRILPVREQGLPLPHVGWNEISLRHKSPVLSGLGGEHFYFTHSYAFSCADEYIAATSEYGVDFVTSVCKDNIQAVQFHPEKSSAAGERLLSNFLAIGSPC